MKAAIDARGDPRLVIMGREAALHRSQVSMTRARGAVVAYEGTGV